MSSLNLTPSSSSSPSSSSVHQRSGGASEGLSFRGHLGFALSAVSLLAVAAGMVFGSVLLFMSAQTLGMMLLGGLVAWLAFVTGVFVGVIISEWCRVAHACKCLAEKNAKIREIENKIQQGLSGQGVQEGQIKPVLEGVKSFLKGKERGTLKLSSCDPSAINGLSALKGVMTEINEIQPIHSLELDGAQLKAVPEWVQDLQGLKKLILTKNQIKTLPNWIGELRSLEELSVCDNTLSELPSSLNNLKALKRLYLGFNPIKICSSLQGINGLEILDVIGNDLSDTPDDLFKCLAHGSTLSIGAGALESSVAKLKGSMGRIRVLDVLLEAGEGDSRRVIFSLAPSRCQPTFQMKEKWNVCFWKNRQRVFQKDAFISYHEMLTFPKILAGVQENESSTNEQGSYNAFFNEGYQDCEREDAWRNLGNACVNLVNLARVQENESSANDQGACNDVFGALMGRCLGYVYENSGLEGLVKRTLDEAESARKMVGASLNEQARLQRCGTQLYELKAGLEEHLNKFSRNKVVREKDEKHLRRLEGILASWPIFNAAAGDSGVCVPFPRSTAEQLLENRAEEDLAGVLL